MAATRPFVCRKCDTIVGAESYHAECPQCGGRLRRR
ncbi:MAG: rubrerythrin-like domain-containing protein [Halolamina sp.]